jgi:glycosyltransferase involved in cell wall biosynthesis
MKITFLHMNQGLVDRGMERVVDLYATELSKRHAVTVIQSGKAVKGKSYKIRRVYPLKTAPQIAPTNLYQKILFRLEKDENSMAVRAFTKAALSQIMLDNPDVIIACNGAPQVRILKTSGSKRKIVVFGAAGLGHHDIKTLHTHPDLYIALTDAAKVWAEQFTDSSTKIAVIPNPVIISKNRRKAQLNMPTPIALTVGALTHYKHIVELTKIMAELPISHVVVGDGEEASALANALSKRAFDFRWIKHVDPEDLRFYYKAANVFCFTPDPREAFGNVYIEAMAANLPIVATDDPVRREIIGNQGYFVDPKDTQAVQNAVVNAIEHGPVDYTLELKRYNVKTVTKQLENALYDLQK